LFPRRFFASVSNHVPDELLTPVGLETLLVHGKYTQEAGKVKEAEAIYRECCTLTKRDVVVDGDVPELLFSRLDTLFQLLLASGQPEMALGVAKVRFFVRAVLCGADDARRSEWRWKSSTRPTQRESA
jgi:hypothetical protein